MQCLLFVFFFFFFSSRRRHTRSLCDWSSDVCSSDLFYGSIGLSEILAASRHHIRNSIDINRLIFVGDSAPDVTNLEKKLVGQLTLNREIERIDHVGAELHVKGLSRASRDVVYAGKGRLRKGGRSRRNWRIVAIDSHAECIGKRGVRGAANGGRAAHRHEVLAALNCLDQPGTQERYKNQVHTVQTAVNAAITTTDHSLVPAEHLADEAVAMVRVQSRR